jgi:hypothetical protein
MNGEPRTADNMMFARRRLSMEVRVCLIQDLHTPDALNRCAACDHVWPCTTYRLARGEPR